MDDMSELLKQFSSIVEKDGIPDNVKDIINNLNTNSSEKEPSNSTEKNNSSFEGIDIATLLKIKSIMDGINNKDDPRTNLLLSLKPYLKENKKSKIDQYIQFLSMSKVFEALKNSGGNLKWD